MSFTKHTTRRSRSRSGIRVELATASGEQARTIEADLTRERVKDLALEKGQEVFVRPTAPRVFEAGQAAE